MKLYPLTPAVIMAAAATLFSMEAAAQSAVQGSIWRNPQDSVHVRVHPCGAGRCGTVIWANDKAKADSARGGTPNLVGTQLFRDFRQTDANTWRGKVFVPDLNRVFSGTGTLVDSNHIVAKGCLMGSVGCKSQTWSRIEGS